MKSHIAKSHITTHVLDTANGVAAEGISVTLDRLTGADWITLGQEYFQISFKHNQLRWKMQSAISGPRDSRRA